MKTTTLAVLTILATLLCGTASAEVIVGFSIIPERTLPGIPVTFRVQLQNTGSEVATLASGAWLDVTKADGTSFVATAQRGEPLWAALAPQIGNSVVLQPGETRVFYQQPDCSLGENEYFFEGRMTLPGEYSLRLRIPAPWEARDVPRREFSSNPVTMTVIEPTGEDAEVWARMQELSARKHGIGFSVWEWADYQFSLANEIYAKWPHSQYLPYVACFKGGTLQERLAFVAQAVALNPPGPMADKVKLSLASLHAFLADEARADLDEAIAVAEVTEARRIIQDVAATTSYEFVRQTTQKALANVGTVEQMRDSIAELREHRTPSPPSLIPIADCVTLNGNGRFTARFGYNNTGTLNVSIAAGSADNNVAAPAEAKKMPSVFEPGEHHRVFKADSTADAIVWRLSGRTATASKAMKKCTGNDKD